MLENGQHHSAIDLPLQYKTLDSWNFKRVNVVGTYTSPVLLFDNQIRNGVAGYEVLSPMKIRGTDVVVLVNRGWVKAPADRRLLPEITTPDGLQKLLGLLWVPPKKTFRLGQDDDTVHSDIRVIEQVDTAILSKLLGTKLLPIVVRMESGSQLGAFDVNWPLPNERVTNHLGYAYQWYGFAAATIGIYLSLFIRNIVRRSDGSN